MSCKGWNLFKKGGHERYYVLTNNVADRLRHRVLIDIDEDINVIYDEILEAIEECKNEAYGKKTMTVKKAKEKNIDYKLPLAMLFCCNRIKLLMHHLLN